MATRQLVYRGDERLTKKCRPVDSFDSHIAELVGDMKQTMIKENGVGLAAPQVGVLRRVFVIRTGDTDDTVREFINPQITETSGEQRETEGCLSCPGLWGVTVRPASVKVTAYDLSGKKFEFSGEGLMARAVCHENDHLDGILFTERVVQWQKK